MTAETANAPCAPAGTDLDKTCDDAVVSDLVAGARDGDARAWAALVERYAPLIGSICRKYRLADADADDVSQTVWLRLVDQLDKVREPAALAGWIATTTRRECGRLARAAHGPHVVGYALDENMADERADAAEREVLAAERQAALRAAITSLPPDGQRLVAALLADPPTPYAQISASLAMPLGSIGPTRTRCLARMRRHPAIAALINE
jgi:RNA polymerase sigma factor (sigma-70 family)